MGRLGVALLILIPLVILGCAGRDFTRPPPESLVLGRTTPDDIKRQLGSPYSTKTTTSNGKRIRTLHYTYAVAGSEAITGGLTTGRTMSFFFFESRLVGYQYLSSFPEDSTDFPAGRVGEIRKGRTTKQDIVDIFGPPHGIHVHPLVENREDRNVIYNYHESLGSAFAPVSQYKILVIQVDNEGIVRDFASISSRDRLGSVF